MVLQVRQVVQALQRVFHLLGEGSRRWQPILPHSLALCRHVPCRMDVAL